MAVKSSSTHSAGSDAPSRPHCVSPDVLASAEHTVESASFTSSCGGGDESSYLNELLHEKKELKSLDPQCNFRHAARLMDGEISRLLETITDPRPDDNSEHVLVTETVYVPVQQYPKYNFVGRLLGPRGMTARQLEEETGCRIMVRGRGSTRIQGKKGQHKEKDSKEDKEKPCDPAEPLHVVVECEDLPHIAEKKVKYAVQLLDKMLHPPPEGKDDLKRKQLIELSIINGTYRPTPATKYALQMPHGGSFEHRRGSFSSSEDRQLPQLVPFFNQTLHSAVLSNPLLAAEYYRSYRTLLSGSEAPVLPGAESASSSPSSPASIHPANPLAYAQAASMLHAIHDGSGDAPKPRRH